MTETDTGAPGTGAVTGALPLPDIVAGLIAEAEATSRRLAALAAELAPPRGRRPDSPDNVQDLSHISRARRLLSE